MTGSTDLFRALEFAHYAERFREKVFVIALTADTHFQDLLLDLKVLTGYRIQAVLVLPDPDFQLQHLIARSNSRGTRFHLSLLTDVLLPAPGGLGNVDFHRIRAMLGEGRTPLIAFHQEQGQAPPEVERTFQLAGDVAIELGADKLFLISPWPAALIEALSRTHYLAAELEGLLEGLLKNLPKEEAARAGPLFRFIREQLERGVPDLILLENQPAYLFREIFTHEGAGILFNQVERAVVRRAETKDITDIGLLLRMDIAEKRILPVDDNEMEADVATYWVYEIDDLLVGAARLKQYGEWAELAQFATLPRYRGRGRARELALRLEQEAAKLAVRHLFALSTDERMWRFFLSLGFQPVEREQLPEAWRRDYDFDRPSRAFSKEL